MNVRVGFNDVRKPSDEDGIRPTWLNIMLVFTFVKLTRLFLIPVMVNVSVRDYAATEHCVMILFPV